jgi:6-pyruvoyltetrahydropterin/6-carboxytetrahydropterin synthase
MKAHLSRRYHFSASHRLHTDTYDAVKNQAVFGKCNNPHGHGHNYTVQVTFSGQVDPATGMVCNLADLDAFAQTNLLARFDHTNLNTLDCFANKVSTTENLNIEIYRIFQRFTAAHLENVHVEETSNNSFEYAGDATPTPGRI